MPDAMLTLERITVGEYRENCYLLSDDSTGQALLIDPGDQAEAIAKWLNGKAVQKIVITHAHHDHIGAVNLIRAALNVPVLMHPADRDLALTQNVVPDGDLADGDTIQLGAYEIKVFHTPGHTPGSVCILFDHRAIVGDAIFPGGPGHTKTPQDLRQSLASLKETVFGWPDETELFPGHGDSTTVGKERPAFNVFIERTLPLDLFGDVSWRGE